MYQLMIWVNGKAQVGCEFDRLTKKEIKAILKNETSLDWIVEVNEHGKAVRDFMLSPSGRVTILHNPKWLQIATREEALALLPQKIKINVSEDSFGNVVIAPVSEKDQKLVSLTNEYDRCFNLYLEFDRDIEDFLTRYPLARYRVAKGHGYKIGRYTYDVKDGNFMIDSWEFRHMLGGQSD